MNLDFIPPMYKSNPSARKLILQTYEKAKREGKYVGFWSREFAELTGIEPADDKTWDNYGEPELVITK